MKLKSIRESYTRFLTVLKDTGIKLTESQKSDLDTFMLALESKMRRQKEATVRATEKVVREKLDKQYKSLVENLIKHMQKNFELSGKIQKSVTKLNESKRIARAVDNYLNLYVESVLPKKSIVDFDKMQKLESVVESLRDILVVNDSVIEEKKKALESKFVSEKKNFETQIAKLQVKLNESMEKNLKTKKELESLKAVELLESKTKDLPSYEARQIKKRFANASVDEINSNFKRVLESVKRSLKEETEEEEATLEDEVNDILENGESSENDTDDEEETDDNSEEDDDSEDEDEDDDDEDDVKVDENGDIHLDESDLIDSKQMKLWISRSQVLS